MRLSDLHKRVIGTRPDERFIATFDTTLISTGSSASNQIALPLFNGGTYDFVVDWGDGSSDVITAFDQAERVHTYAIAGIYDIKINGLLRGWRFSNAGDRLKILDIKNWGKSVQYTGSPNTLTGVYYGCNNMNFTATDSPVILGNMINFFRDCSFLVGNSSINKWNVSSSTNFNSTFRSASIFNQPINNWNVSNSTSFSFMFTASLFFNQPLNNWDISNSTNLSSMFTGASIFNQDISNWNVSKVTNLNSTFANANNFAQSLGDWKLNPNVTLTSTLNLSNTTIGTNLQEWYSRTLIGWANDVFARGGVPSGRSLGATNRRYNNTAYTTGLQFNDAVSARAYLVNTAGWTITGDAQI
jgi:surface protein